jgi:hypothetical protein
VFDLQALPCDSLINIEMKMPFDTILTDSYGHGKREVRLPTLP